MLTEHQLALWRAIKAKDEAKAIEALENLDNINFMVNLGYRAGLIPCISYLIQHSMNDLLSRALDKGVDLTAKDSKFGNSPLHWAATTNNQVAIALLLVHETDKQALNKANQRPVQLLPSDATLETRNTLNSFSSLQSLASIALGANPPELPTHLEKPQATFLQNYDLQVKQRQDNQIRMEELNKAMSSLSFLSPS
jgi:hypothetical protein